MTMKEIGPKGGSNLGVLLHLVTRAKHGHLLVRYKFIGSKSGTGYFVSVLNFNGEKICGKWKDRKVSYDILKIESQQHQTNPLKLAFLRHFFIQSLTFKPLLSANLQI